MGFLLKLFSGLMAAAALLFPSPAHPNTTPVTHAPATIAAAAILAPSITAIASSALPSLQTLKQSSGTFTPVTTGVVLGTSTEMGYVTQDELAADIVQLQSFISQQLDNSTSTYAYDDVWNAIAATQRINNLSGTANSPLTISDATLTSVSGLTAAEIPTLNYFPASSTISIAYGGTGTSTAPGANELLLSDANGNWEYVATSSLGISGAVALTGIAGQVAYFNGTNTSVGTSSLFISSSDNVGIGTTSPAATLSVSGNAYFTGGLGLGAVNARAGTLNGWTPTWGILLSNGGVPTSAGTNYAVGDSITLNAGCSVNPVIVVNQLSGSSINDYTVITNGTCSSIPANPVSQLSTTGSGSGASFTLSWGPLASNLGYPTLTSGGANLFLGGGQPAAISGRENTFVGDYAGGLITTGAFNTSLGEDALGIGGGCTVNVNQSSNTSVGDDALRDFCGGSGNVAVGAGALKNASSTNGINSQTAIGSSAMLNWNGGNGIPGNSVVGSSAGAGTSGSSTYLHLSALGYEAGFVLTTGNDDTLLGDLSGSALTSGADNLFVGSNTGSTTVTGSSNLALGYDVALPVANGSNQLDIGNLIYGTGLNGQGQTLSAGNIGIGTTTPYSRLTLWGSDSASSTAALTVANSASTTEFQVFDGGNAQLAGTLTQNSDQRLKTNIQSLDASGTLALIDQLNPVTFNWIDPNQGNGTQVGFIAQQVQLIFPELVSTTSATALTPGGTLGLNYIGLISPIVSAIQALSAEVQSLAAEVQGFAQSFTSQQVTTSKLCLSDSNGTSCYTRSQIDAALGNIGQSSDQSSSFAPPADDASTTADMPPTITIEGDNPAIITVGSGYADLGATVTDTGVGQAGDTNLGYKIFLNGALVSNIVIGTTAVATDTIDYVATDHVGNSATSTRTVIIEALSAATTTAQ